MSDVQRFLACLPGPAYDAGAGPGLRFLPVKGDHCGDLASCRDLLVCVPCDEYIGEGYYILDPFGGSPACYIAQYMGRKTDEVRIRHPNLLYSEHMIARERFAEVCVGRVVAVVKMVDIIDRLEAEQESLRALGCPPMPLIHPAGQRPRII